MKKCSACAEEIQDEAVKCRYCGETFGATPDRGHANPGFGSLHPVILGLVGMGLVVWGFALPAFSARGLGALLANIIPTYWALSSELDKAIAIGSAVFACLLLIADPKASLLPSGIGLLGTLWCVKEIAQRVQDAPQTSLGIGPAPYVVGGGYVVMMLAVVYGDWRAKAGGTSETPVQTTPQDGEERGAT